MRLSAPGIRIPLAIAGVTVLLVPDLLHTALLMLIVPAIQNLDSVGLSWTLERILPATRTVGVVLLAPQLWDGFRTGSRGRRIRMAVLALACAAAEWIAATAQAERVFRPPHALVFQQGSANALPPETIVVGITNGTVAKAYPVRLLAFHHLVPDSVGDLPVLVTYCSLCRTARVYQLQLDGRPLRFRLVGANHYDAMMEDDRSGSWWYQATGEAIAGPRTGRTLAPVRGEQMTLRAWTALHPQTLVMQPDPASTEGYAMFAGWDTVRTHATRADSLGDWSWVLGLTAGAHARAYAWLALARAAVVNDTIGAAVPVVIAVEPDHLSFHAWQRRVHDEVLAFQPDPLEEGMRDTLTNSRWNYEGVCVAGPLEGQRLDPMPATQEYWHSWRFFHPATSVWTSPTP